MNISRLTLLHMDWIVFCSSMWSNSKIWLCLTVLSPGVHWLQDPRSRVYNFTPWLQRIPKVNDFAFERLIGFVSSSRDEVGRRPSLVSFLCGWLSFNEGPARACEKGEETVCGLYIIDVWDVEPYLFLAVRVQRYRFVNNEPRIRTWGKSIISFLGGLDTLTVTLVVSFIHDWPKNAFIRRAKPQRWYLRNRLIYAWVRWSRQECVDMAGVFFHHQSIWNGIDDSHRAPSSKTSSLKLLNVLILLCDLDPPQLKRTRSHWWGRHTDLPRS